VTAPLAIRIVFLAGLSLGMGAAQTMAASVPAETAHTTAAETHGFNPQPDPPGLPQCEVLSFYNAHVSSCEAKLIAAYPPGPCKTESYMNRHFTSCVATIRSP
jgi:hypothetical protein